MEKENNKLVRVKLAGVLVKVGRFSCAEYLVHLLESPYKDSQSWGRDQLVKISGKDLGFNHSEWSRWFEEETKRREPGSGGGCARDSWIDQ
jgi:hypothetical protein